MEKKEKENMKHQKILDLIEMYRGYFESIMVPKIKFDFEKYVIGQDGDLAHCHYMLDEMTQFVADNRIGKVMRWIGFIQGVLWSRGLFTIDDLMNHNKP